jgi:predicted nuclease with TOPRIM domain
MRIYEISEEFRTLRDLAENEQYDSETGEIADDSQTIKELFDSLCITLSDKLEGCAYILNELELQSDALKREAKRLNERAKRLDNNYTSLKSLMLSALVELPEAKLKTQKFTFSTRKSESVNIEEGFNMQGKYSRVKTTYEPDKTAIKTAIKAGECVIGAELVTNTTLTIK